MVAIIIIFETGYFESKSAQTGWKIRLRDWTRSILSAQTAACEVVRNAVS